MTTNRPASDSSAIGLSVPEMLNLIRHGDTGLLGTLLELYRNYLNVIASSRIGNQLKRRMNPSDIVQETMLAAHRDMAGFRGGSEGELVAWLRQILSGCLGHAVERNVLAKKRDLRREVSFEDFARNKNGSIFGAENALAAKTPTPSEDCQNCEQSAQLTLQIAKLKPEYRDVIVYRNLKGLSFDDIAQRMNLKPGTVRMMWLRAIEKLKQSCDDSKPQA